MATRGFFVNIILCIFSTRYYQQNEVTSTTQDTQQYSLPVRVLEDTGEANKL